MAGRFSVEAVFKAVDRVTAPVSRMQNRVGKFTRSMSRGLRRVDRAFGKMFAGMKRGATAGVAGLTVALGVASLALKGTADKADALAKQSRRLDFPIEELQEWKFVAEQSGVSTELFDKSIGAFTKRLGEARAGTGALRTILKKSNPALLEQLQATDDVSEALEMYIKAIREAPTAADKAALASAAFSRAGLKMTNITDNNTEAIKALRREQRENGVITREQANNAEAWNDAMNSLKKSLIGLRDSALAPLFPRLTELARSFRDVVIANQELISSKIGDWFDFIVDNFAEIVTWVKRVGIAFGVFLGIMTILKTFIAVMTAVNLVMALNPIGLIVLGVAALIAGFTALIVWIDAIKAGFDKLPGVVQALLLPFGLLIDAIKFIKDNGLGEWIDAIKAGFEKLPHVVQALLLPFGLLIDAIVAIKDNWSEVSSAFSRLGAFFGFDGGDEDEEPARQSGAPQVVSPQDRTARSIEEQRTTSSAEVTIRPAEGTEAEKTRGAFGPGVQLQRTGAF